MHSLFFSERFGLVIDVDCCSRSIHDFLLFGFLKYIHFFVFCHNLMPKQNFAHCFSSTCCSVDVESIFLLFGSLPWHADNHKWFSNQHVTSMPFVVEFAYSPYSNNAFNLVSVYLDVLCLSNWNCYFWIM